jgi:FtsP/CotA-like multicopper oxidase with cupredoxin domain
MKRSRRDFIRVSAVVGAGALVPRDWWMRRAAAQVVAQVPLAGNKIPQFVDPLPSLYITGATTLDIGMSEFLSPVMPTGFVPAVGAYQGTYVWGYRTPDMNNTNSPSYLGPVILATRGIPTQMNFVNSLGNTTSTNVLAYKNSVDQTLMWADPLNYSANACNAASDGPPAGVCALNYDGPIPAVVHLHGGEVPPQLDGGPDAWYTGDGLYKGHAYWTWAGTSAPATPLGGAIYRYPNTQEASPIWFHDHTLGATRLNVYAGLAGGYLIHDPLLNLPTGLTAFGIGTETIIPLIIQDRMFDTNGQLYFPAGVPFITNPEHPFWVPEFVGDTIVVNGKVWPFKAVDRKRYRFLFLNGSNARTYDLSLADRVSGVRGPRMWVIGTDGGYLDAPKLIDPNSTNKAVPKSLVIMPGERYDVIIDFNDPVWLGLLGAAGVAFPLNTLELQNTAKTPYPGGAPAPKSTTGRVVQFRVSNTAPPETGFDPSAVGAVIRPAPMVRLVNPVAGTPAAGVTVHKTRQLTLNEVMGPGGPLEVLVNNTKLSGKSVAIDTFGPEGIRGDFVPVTDPIPDAPVPTSVTTYYSELPIEGETELWEIVNMTADAHPMHTHLVQFQVMNRQPFDVKGYNAAYNAFFPGTTTVNDPMTGLPFPAGVFIGGFGPPLDYNTGGPIGVAGPPAPKLGGNPDVTPFLVKKSVPAPPLPHEQGWKDTVVTYPGQVTRILVRWAPTDILTTAAPADLHFPFDPDGGHGYVFHCHIIDHEDNEMMRPDQVQLNPAAPLPANRPLKSGTDY